MLSHQVCIFAALAVLANGKHFLIETEDADDTEAEDPTNTKDYQDINISAGGKLRKTNFRIPLSSSRIGLVESVT